MKILDKDGLAYFWTKIKAYVSGLGYMLKTATNKVTAKEFLFRDVDNDALRIGGGSAHAKGGNILLYGKDHASHPGRVDFQAYDGTNYATLKFEPTETRPVFYWLNGYGSGSEQVAYLTDLSGYVPSTRTVNGKALSSNISLTASDVGAAASSHTQASNTINLLTGYSKPSSGSALATTDTLNEALGKLEAKVDAVDDSNYVHKTNNELITGLKVFYTNEPDYIGRNVVSRLVIKNNNILKGTTPEHTIYSQLLFTDNSNNSYEADGSSITNRLGILQCYVSSSTNVIQINAYKQSTEVSEQNNSASLTVGYDSNGVTFATAPSTSVDRTSGNDIVTRDWIPNDTRIVHTSYSETISGIKTFNNSVYGKVRFGVVNDNVSYNSNPSSTTAWGYVFDDKDSNHIGRCICSKDSNGTTWVKFSVNKPGTTDWSEESYLNAVCTASGLRYAQAPTANADSNSTTIATTNWVRTATGNTSLNAATATALKTARAFRVHLDTTSTDSFDGTANCTPGVTGILGVANGGTGLSSLSTFVRTTGAQTIAGTKTFSDTMVFNSANIKHADNAHAFYVCGGNGNAATNGAYMILCGSGWTDNPGKFYLRATTTSSNTRALIGTPGGNLTWNGSVIQTSSDARLKTPMSDVPDDALDAWEDVRWGRFKMLDAVEEKGAEKARFHVGLIAQQAKAAFDARGLDGCAYGILCYDDADFDDLWMVRYTEALCMEAAYMRRENARLKQRVSDLEDRLAALELRLGSE